MSRRGGFQNLDCIPIEGVETCEVESKTAQS